MQLVFGFGEARINMNARDGEGCDLFLDNSTIDKCKKRISEFFTIGNSRIGDMDGSLE